MKFAPFYYPIAMFCIMQGWRLTRKRLNALIHRRLERVLVSAYRHVPHYRQVMQAAGYNPEKNYRGVADLSHLPISTKEERRVKSDSDFIMEGVDLSRCICDGTSGSTGIPLRIYRTPRERAFQIAKWLRVMFVNGYSPRFKVMTLTLPEKTGQKINLLQQLGFFRRKMMSFLEPPEKIVDQLLAYGPDVLYGNRQQIDFIALELQRRNIRLDALKLLIESGAIVRQDSRRFHRKQFGTELIESYGSEEMGIMAHDISDKTGLCLCEDTTFFEFLDENGLPVPPGQPGRVVVTDLFGTLNPFIRYDQGDLAIYEHIDTPDGGRGRRIVKILGRECDYVVMPDGTHRLYYDFYDIMSRYEDLFQCRVVQKTRHLIQIQVVAASDYLNSIREDLITQLQKPFPPDIRFEIVSVDKIPSDPSGKIRMFISEIDSLPDLTPNMHRPDFERKDL